MNVVTWLQCQFAPRGGNACNIQTRIANFTTSNIKESRQVREGDVVLVGDDNRKRINWPLARIEKLILGRDGVVRVAILKTKDGRLKRPIQRIYPLEINNDNVEEREILHEKIVDKRTGNLLTPESQENQNIKEVKTRSGRVIRKPNFYN